MEAGWEEKEGEEWRGRHGNGRATDEASLDAVD